MRIGIVGSRKFPDPVLVVDFVASLPVGTVIVSGGAIGVDTWAYVAAKALGYETIIHRPDYSTYPPKVAPLERNRLIVFDSDVVVAFWDGSSRGTLDTYKKARAMGKVVYLVAPGRSYPAVI